MPIIYNREQGDKAIKNMEKTSQNNRIGLDKMANLVYNTSMKNNDTFNERKYIMKNIYQKTTTLYSAEINTLDPKLNKVARFEAKFVTAKGIIPRSYLSCGFQTIKGCHDMIKWQVENTLRNNQETT